MAAASQAAMTAKATPASSASASPAHRDRGDRGDRERIGRSTLPVPRATTRRMSTASDSSESSTPEPELYDDVDSIMEHANDSQSSLGVSLHDMDLDRLDYEEQCRRTPINRLPAEILISVFARLSSPADLRRSMLVCKSWARNAVDLLWHRPDTREWRKLVNVIQTARKTNGYFAYHDLIKRLNLAQLAERVSDGTLEPMSTCKRIERLTLTNCKALSDLSVTKVIEGSKNLLAIDLSGLDKITDESLFAVAKNCYRLQGLNVTKCTAITDESLVAVAQNCRRVKRLKFNDCVDLTDRSFLAFADHCHDILEIDCCGCQNLTNTAVTALIKEGRQLRELRLQHCGQISDNAFLELPFGTTYDALRILDLTDCELLQDAGLDRIISAAPRLRNLVLAKCRLITDRGVVSVTRLGKNLHYIHLGHCGQITDFGVTMLIRQCNRIRYIDLACCQHLTDASVSMLALLPKLKRIGLVKCQLITDDSIKALAAPRLHGPNMLERLHLSYCTLLTVDGVREMLLNCPRLTHLSLTGVSDFLAPELVQFCREAPPEFNDHQRDMFCVYSGEGVAQLRDFLKRAATMHDDDAALSEDSDAYAYPRGQDAQAAADVAAARRMLPQFALTAPPVVPPHGPAFADWLLRVGLVTRREQMAMHQALREGAYGTAAHGNANRPPPPPPAPAHRMLPYGMMDADGLQGAQPTFPPGVEAVDDGDDTDQDQDMREGDAE